MIQKLSEVEIVKEKSNYLRGTIQESQEIEVTGALHHEDTHLIKFHGSYQQTDRDLESERKKQKLEPLYSFMLRVRVPGGVASSKQWLKINELSDQYGNETIKLTTRQAFQLHGVFKRNLKKTIKGINDSLLDTIAGCGDVNRNVMCNPNPYQSVIHEEVYETAKAISAYFTPHTSSYFELWVNEKLAGGAADDSADAVKNKALSTKTTPVKEDHPYSMVLPNLETGIADSEPIYGKTYLPRKFKIALAIPPHNDVDIFANDVGLIAIEENGRLIGFNVAAGGGLGMTFGMPETYPRLADVLGFIPKDQTIQVCEQILLIQKDWGNRENRKFSRLKYTIDRVGLTNFKLELNRRLGYELDPPLPYQLTSNGDAFGWSDGTNGKYHVSLFIEGGRIKDTEKYLLKTALKEVALVHDGDFRLTGNQNLMICNISKASKPAIAKILENYGVLHEINKTAMRLHSLACVALNTCSLAFAEAERYLPQLIDRLDEILRENNLERDAIVIRMTGCPNGCARPYLGEIGFVGKAVGRYNLYLGAGFAGQRMNKLYKEMLNEEEIISTLKPIITAYAKERLPKERFGDFTIRKGYVKETTEGIHFHDN